MGFFVKLMDEIIFNFIENGDSSMKEHLASKIGRGDYSDTVCSNPDCFCSEILAAYRHAPPNLKDEIYYKLLGCE